jgi:hypothetical protein
MDVEGPVVVLAPPPTLTPFPEADTPVLWVDSLPLVGRNLEARPSEASLSNSPSIPVLTPLLVVVLVPVLGIVNLTLNSLELVFVLGPALISPFVCPFVLTRAFDGEITSWRASGKSADRGGANIESAPEGPISVGLAGKAEDVPLGS